MTIKFQTKTVTVFLFMISETSIYIGKKNQNDKDLTTSCDEKVSQHGKLFQVTILPERKGVIVVM